MPLVFHEMIVDALADLHTQFWDHPWLRQDIGALTRDVPQFSFSMASQHFTAFVDALGDRLSTKRRDTYEKILSQYPRYHRAGQRRWYMAMRGGELPLSSRPRNSQSVPDRLGGLARQSWRRAGTSPITLIQYYPERPPRGSHQPLVRRYHDRLLANDIHAYAWAQCWEDYRRMVIEQCVWPIVWHHFDLSPTVWWFALECTLAAFEDLHCEEFL